MPDPSPSNADSLKLQLLTARKKEWWPATAESLPQAVYLTTVKHTALVVSFCFNFQITQGVQQQNRQRRQLLQHRRRRHRLFQ